MVAATGRTTLRSRHEMFFGLMGAAICVFLFTVVPNSTGQRGFAD
jgi:uncharacterized protein involved in response to NO